VQTQGETLPAAGEALVAIGAVALAVAPQGADCLEPERDPEVETVAERDQEFEAEVEYGSVCEEQADTTDAGGAPEHEPPAPVSLPELPGSTGTMELLDGCDFTANAEALPEAEELAERPVELPEAEGPVEGSVAGAEALPDREGQAVGAVEAAVSAAPRASFRFPVHLVWSLWNEAYFQAYGLPYLRTSADHGVVPGIALATAAAVLHLEARSAGPAPLDLRLRHGSAFLRHVFDAFLRLPGSRDFLRLQRHPLRALPGDLNRLGASWGPLRQGVVKADARKEAPRGEEGAKAKAEETKGGEVLSPEEQKARARELLGRLGAPSPGAPRPRPPTRKMPG